MFQAESIRKLAEKQEELELLQGGINGAEENREKLKDNRSDIELADLRAEEQKGVNENAERRNDRIVVTKQKVVEKKAETPKKVDRQKDEVDPRFKAPEIVTENKNSVVTVQFEEKDMEFSAPKEKEARFKSRTVHSDIDNGEPEADDLEEEKSIFLKEREFPDSESEMSRSSKERDNTLVKSEAAATFEMMVQDDKAKNEKRKNVVVKRDSKSAKRTKPSKVSANIFIYVRIYFVNELEI